MNDLKSMLDLALTHLGCDTSKFDYDTHSPVSVAFSDIGDLVIVPDEDTVWFWNELIQGTSRDLAHAAPDILVELASEAPYLRSGALCVRENEHAVWLGGPLAPGHIADADLLASAIEAFHESMTRCKAVLL